MHFVLFEVTCKYAYKPFRCTLQLKPRVSAISRPTCACGAAGTTPTHRKLPATTMTNAF